MKLISIVPIILLLMLLLLPQVSIAARPSQASSSGITIVSPVFEFYPRNDTATSALHFHIFNTTSGINISSTAINCSIHIYNSSNNHITRSFLVEDGEDMEYIIPNNITGSRGFYQYIVWCNATAGAYGWVESSFVMNYEGEGIIFDGGWIIAVLICLIPIILAFYLIKWSDDLGEEHFGAKFGIRMFSLSLFFASLYLTYLSLLKYFIWVRMQDTMGTLILLVGGLFALILFYFLIVYIKDMFASIQRKRRHEDE